MKGTWLSDWKQIIAFWSCGFRAHLNCSPTSPSYRPKTNRILNNFSHGYRRLLYEMFSLTSGPSISKILSLSHLCCTAFSMSRIVSRFTNWRRVSGENEAWGLKSSRQCTTDIPRSDLYMLWLDSSTHRHLDFSTHKSSRGGPLVQSSAYETQRLLVQGCARIHVGESPSN